MTHPRLRPRAVHEAGHAIAALVFDTEFSQLRAAAWSGRVDGGTLGRLQAEHPRSWCVFAAAGLSAEMLWLAQNDLSEQLGAAHNDSAEDNGNLALWAPRAGISVGKARAEAGELVVANWRQIVALSVVLERQARMRYDSARRVAGPVKKQDVR